MPTSLFLLQGAPGIGKSTIAQHLKESFPQGYFLEVDTIRSFMGKPVWEAHDETYYTALEAAVRLTEFLLEKGLAPIFIIDCLTEKGVAQFLTYFSAPPPMKQIILWAEDTRLEERLSGRKDHPFSNREIALNMNGYLREYAEKANAHIHFLNTSHQTAAQVAKEIEAHVTKA